VAAFALWGSAPDALEVVAAYQPRPRVDDAVVSYLLEHIGHAGKPRTT
jgi:hypothetical protein